MSATTTRRPLPAVAFLAALLVLASIVWWRVLHRDDSNASATPKPTPSVPSRCSGGKPVTLPATKSVTVYVRNGNGASGLATRVDSALKARGFVSGGVPNDADQIAGVGQIVYAPAQKTSALLLSYYVPGAKLVVVNRPDKRIDLVLGTGFKALASAAQVTQSVTAAKKPC